MDLLVYLLIPIAYVIGSISFAVFLLRWALLYFDEAKDWGEGFFEGLWV